jgi:hypothetical protein
MINRKPNVLKGQHILAQGNALGINSISKIVRPARQGLSGGALMFIKDKFSFRTKWIIQISQQSILFYSVRNKFFAIFILFSRTVSIAIPLPGALPRAMRFCPCRALKSKSFGVRKTETNIKTYTNEFLCQSTYRNMPFVYAHAG